MKSIVLVFLLVVLGGMTVPDAGANEAGGLPALDARVKALETTVASLQAANTTLQATVASLQAANATLQTALNTEIAARVAGIPPCKRRSPRKQRSGARRLPACRPPSTPRRRIA